MVTPQHWIAGGWAVGSALIALVFWREFKRQRIALGFTGWLFLSPIIVMWPAAVIGIVLTWLALREQRK